MLRLLVITVILSLFFSSYGSSMWKPEYTQLEPGIQEWYQNAKDAKGNGCCSRADGFAYYGNVVVEPDGSIIVEANGVLHKIEKDKVLTGPNPTGHAVWWYVEYNGVRTTRCFALGAGL